MLHGKAFATHDRQDTRSIFAASQHLVGLCRKGGDLLPFKTECFSFLLARLSPQSNCRKRSNLKPFPDEWPSALRDVTEGR